MVRSMSPAQCLKKESPHLQYILWQIQTSIQNVHFFLQLHLRKKKNTNHKGQNGTFASNHPRSPQLRPWGPAQRCAFSSLSRSQKTPWLANRHAPEKTHVKAATNSELHWEFAGLDFVRCLHVPHVDFYNCWKFAISVLDYSQVRALFETAGSEVNQNIRRSKTHTTLMFSLWTCIALFSANPTQDSSDPSVNPKHFTTFFKSYIGRKYLKVQGPKI